jgi:hypothetical protein
MLLIFGVSELLKYAREHRRGSHSSLPMPLVDPARITFRTHQTSLPTRNSCAPLWCSVTLYHCQRSSRFAVKSEIWSEAR